MYRVVVLDAGKLAEMDSPSVLLALENGLFAGLWERHQRSHGKRLTSSGSTSRDSIADLALEADKADV